MVGNLHVFVPIDLEDVAMLFVNGEPTHHVAPVKMPAAYNLQQSVREPVSIQPSNISWNGIQDTAATDCLTSRID